jgi:tRNA(His) 5'-end guanylyltransferase
MEHTNILNKIDPKDLKPVSFDSRVIPLYGDGVLDYFKNRQDEAWRNCLNGYSYWKLREEFGKSHAVEILNKKKSSELHEILFERGLNLAEMPAWQRRGIGLYKKTIPITGYNPINSERVVSNRLRVYTDWELPLLNEDFFKSNLIKLTNH